MGIVSSRAWSSDQASSSDGVSCNGVELCLPQDVLIEILSYVPAFDLLNNCALVCHQWEDLISGHSLWKRKCVREGKRLPPFTLKEVPKNFYRQIYIYNPYGRNLLKNPCGEEGMKHWVIEDNQGDGWKVENPPGGADEVPKKIGSQSCFATSYGLCSKYQMIDLYKEGITSEMIRLVPMVVDAGEWHAARFDCGCTYNLSVFLLNKNQGNIQYLEIGPFSESQWTGRSWSKASTVITDYPEDFRYIGFQHSGQDTQFWAGHYGSKMTGGYIQLDYSIPR